MAIGYLSDIVPIFRRRCYSCHAGEGKARAKFDLTERGWVPYMLIVGWPSWGRKDVFPGSDWLSQKPRLETAPLPVRPGPFSAHADPETVAREYNFPK